MALNNSARGTYYCHPPFTNEDLRAQRAEKWAQSQSQVGELGLECRQSDTRAGRTACINIFSSEEWSSFYSGTPLSFFDGTWRKQASDEEQAGPAGMGWRLHGGSSEVVTGFGWQAVGSPLTRNWPPLPSSSSRMYPSAGTVDRGGCFQDSVALLLWVQHSSSCRMGVAGTGEEAKQKLV